MTDDNNNIELSNDEFKCKFKIANKKSEEEICPNCILYNNCSRHCEKYWRKYITYMG